jgi:hypothetical protein
VIWKITTDGKNSAVRWARTSGIWRIADSYYTLNQWALVATGKNGMDLEINADKVLKDSRN